jgi:hypothetical protein
MRLSRTALIGIALSVALMGQSLLGQAGGGGSTAGGPFDRLHFRSIGPSIMSGRISDFAVYEANTSIFYVSTAHGGVWKTESNGALFAPVFDKNGLMSIGDVTISQKDPNLVWVGTGEGNNRQSISWGDGIYKTTDGAKTWKNMGLTHSYHINRIVIDPNDNNVVFVAAQGNLFGPGGERGVYRTSDGGATWKQVLKVDDDTGANEVVMDPTNPKILYASTYQRRRSQCCMNGGGPGSGIWKSTDGGDNWTRLTNGVPAGSLGRIALDVYRKSPNILYAQIEAEAPAGGRSGGSAGNAPGESGTYRSDDGGASWRKTSSNDVRPMYFSQIRVDPNNPDRVITGGVRMYLSTDGGTTFNPADPTEHDDKHALWWDPNNSNHILIGTDGGAYVSYDMTRTFIFYPNIVAGLFYHVGFDYEYPYNVCGGMQDNYDWCGPSAVRTRGGIPADRWQSIQGGDGFVAIIDARDSHIVYAETQDGNTMRHNKITGESKSIRPSAQNVVNAVAGEPNYRFNWDTPMMFSPTDPGVLYIAGNRVFRSTDRGDSWTAISPDLTTNADRNQVVTMAVKGSDVRISKDDGIAAWPTLVSFAESPKVPGLYFAGSDDGVVSMSKDAGKTWDKTLADRLPGFVKGAWTSKVMPSRYDAATVYIASDAHRLGDYETHVWVSNDTGATFRSLNGNLKGEAIKTLTEDQRNPDVIYAGAETGLFVTLDRGKNWQRIDANYPNVRTDEITLHPRDNAMLLATHGRAIWILDHISPIQEYAAAQAAASGAKLFSIDPALEWKSFDDKNDEFWGHQYFMGENPPGEAVIQYYLKNTAKDAKLTIADAAGKMIRELPLAGNRLEPGIQTACWDFRVEPLNDNAAAAAAAAGRGAPGGGGAGAGGGGAAGGGGGGGGRRGAAGGGSPTSPLPQPEPGFSSANVCGGGAGGFGGGGGRGGGGGPQGPLVPAGNYNVTLSVDGKTIESKAMKVVMDPAIQMSEAQQKRYFDMAMELHDLQRRGTQMKDALTPLDTQVKDAATKVADSKSVPAAVKTQFTEFEKDLNAIGEKFGVGATGGGGRGGRGGGGGGGGRGGAAGGGRAGGGGAAAAGAGAAAANATAAPVPDPAQAGGAGFGGFGGGAANANDLVAKAGTVKGSIMAFSEMPSATVTKQYDDVRVALPKAISDANAFLITRATAMSATLKKYDIELKVPAPIK